jgi:hypothetical protein
MALQEISHSWQKPVSRPILKLDKKEYKSQTKWLHAAQYRLREVRETQILGDKHQIPEDPVVEELRWSKTQRKFLFCREMASSVLGRYCKMSD